MKNNQTMISLTEEELLIVEGWYYSAAGESASGLSIAPITQWKKEYHDSFYAQIEVAKKVKALVDKLGFEYHHADEYMMKHNGLL